MGILLTHVQEGGEVNMMKMKSHKISIVEAHSQGFFLLMNPFIPTSCPALVELGSLTLIHIRLFCLSLKARKIAC